VFEFHSDGVENAQLQIRAQANETGRKLRRIVEDAAEFGATVMRREVPKRTHRLERRITSTDADFRPGGAGGGGVYTAEFGFTDDPGPERDLPFWVYHGTGVFKDDPSFGGGLNPIFPLGDQPMRYFDNGQWHVRYSVRGQRPQKEWVEESYEAAAEYMDFRTASMFT
jgi:hypothetical protein